MLGPDSAGGDWDPDSTSGMSPGVAGGPALGTRLG